MMAINSAGMEEIRFRLGFSENSAPDVGNFDREWVLEFELTLADTEKSSCLQY